MTIDINTVLQYSSLSCKRVFFSPCCLPSVQKSCYFVISVLYNLCKIFRREGNRNEAFRCSLGVLYSIIQIDSSIY